MYEELLYVNELSSLDWYVEPTALLPVYLQQPNKNMKTIARFRCGAESRATEKWRASDRCRMCSSAKETFGHLMECVGGSWCEWRQICAEDGADCD